MQKNMQNVKTLCSTKGLKNLGESCLQPLFCIKVPYVFLKAFVRKVNFFLQGGDQSEEMHRIQVKIKGNEQGIELSYFFPRITFLRILFLEIQYCPSEDICCVSVSQGRYSSAPFFTVFFLPGKSGSSASSPAADPYEPQPLTSLCEFATSSPWCHPPPFLGNSPSLYLLSYAVPSQSSHTPKSKSGTTCRVPNFIWLDASHIVRCSLLLAQPSEHLLHHHLSCAHANQRVALFICEH